MKRILLIEDERNLAAFIRKGLTEEGYRIFVAHDGPAGLELLEREEVDMVILDIMLPGINGLDLCRLIRSKEHRDLPVLVLSALGTTENIVEGLDTGADDYLVKPFKFEELSARIRALSRRKNLADTSGHILCIADLVLDCDAKTVTRAGRPVKLTSTEYRLLEYFTRNQRKVLSRVDILENVWGITYELGTNVVDVYVNYLRNKIDKGFEPRLIQTVVGMGYMMKASAVSHEDPE